MLIFVLLFSFYFSKQAIDGVLQGLVLSVFLGLLSAALNLFWNTGQGQKGHGDGSPWDLMALFFLSILSLTTLAFAIAAVFDNPQTAGMCSFLLMIGDVVLFFILTLSSPELFDTAAKQQLWCLFPPLALQIGIWTRFNCGCGFFNLMGKTQIDLGTVLSMLVLDAVIFASLAW
jgi:hypothetical protein